MAFGMRFRGLAITKLNERTINGYLLLHCRLLMSPTSFHASWLRLFLKLNIPGIRVQSRLWECSSMLAEGNIVSIP
jgi:hypothetical protein